MAEAWHCLRPATPCSGGTSSLRNITNGPGGCGCGGGIATANFSQARVINNVIAGNVACSGGGIYWGGSTGTNVFVNNTIADNVASVSWPGMYVSGFDARNQLHNNIITAKSGPAFYCQNAPSLSSPVLTANDIFSGEGPAYGGTCADRTGLDGNISVDPKFIDATAGDYRVAMSSAAVDTGNDPAPHLPAMDVTGNQRIVDGNGDGRRASISVPSSIATGRRWPMRARTGRSRRHRIVARM